MEHGEGDKGMGLFDKFKKKMVEPVAPQEEEINAAGWDAIAEACREVYPTQSSEHYGTIICWELGGNDPLDGIDVYDAGEYWHFVTYGLTELYEKESEDKDVSGFGMEFTFKLKKDNYEDEKAEIKCVCGILQTIARLTFTKGEIFSAYEYLYTGQKQGIDTKMQSNITGFITMPDKELKSIDTPNGKVDFVEFIGVTDSELTALRNKEITVKELYEKLGSDITNYHRKAVI